MNQDQIIYFLLYRLQQYHLLSSIDKIYLYGSRTQKPRAKSDLDIAISAPVLTLNDWLKILWVIEQLPCLVPVDLLWLEKTNHTTQIKILREGKLLYERDE